MSNNQIKQFENLFETTLNDIAIFEEPRDTSLTKNITETVTLNDSVNAQQNDTRQVSRKVFTIEDIVNDIYSQNSQNANHTIKQPSKDDDKNLFSGHRERARERFMQNDTNSISDYDLLELMFFLIKPRIDVKSDVKRIIDHFRNIRNIANATEMELAEFTSNPRLLKYIFKLCNAVHGRVIYNNIQNNVVLNNWDYMIEYLRSQLCDKDQECFMVFFLNSKYQLINQKIVAYGDVDRVGINPKGILKDAINYNSKIIIVSHNHPSGIAEPSNNDIEITDTLLNITNNMDIILFDHIIITNKSYFSFREHDLLSL